VKIKIYILILFSYKGFLLLGQNWYTGVDAGYSFGLASQNITSNISIGRTQSSNTLIKGSFGKGINLNGYMGYLLKHNMSCEVGLSYLNGANFKGRSSKDSVFTQDLSISGNMLRISPCIKISSDDKEKKTRVYLKVGFVARLAGKITVESKFFEIQSNTETFSETKFSKGLSLGATATAGFDRLLTERTKLFADVFFIAQSWAPKNGDIIKYSVNGVDQLDVLNPVQKHIQFNNNYTTTTNAQSTFQPSQQLKQYHNFSSIGFKIGLQVVLGKK
jgi:hypothetical protein